MAVRPDSVIKLFLPENFDDGKDMYREMKQFEGLVIQISESISGNIFTRPYPFVAFRNVQANESIPERLQDDGDPFADYFQTLRSIRKEVPKMRDTLGFVLLAFKVLNDDNLEELDDTWPSWTGTSSIIRNMIKEYDVKSVTCFKGLSLKPDHFKYCVLIEIVGEDLNHAFDTMQKFRIRRMSGFAAFYHQWDRNDQEAVEDIMEVAGSTESIGAIIQSIDY